MAEVVLTSSLDFNFLPQNAVDGNEQTFWVSTGMYPQELLIKLPSAQQVKQLNTATTNVQKIIIEGGETDQASSFEKLGESDYPNTGGRMQNQTINLKQKSIQYLKVTISSGWDDFASVHSIKFNQLGGAGATLLVCKLFMRSKSPKD